MAGLIPKLKDALIEQNCLPNTVANGDAARGVSPLDGVVRPAPLSAFSYQLA